MTERHQMPDEKKTTQVQLRWCLGLSWVILWEVDSAVAKYSSYGIFIYILRVTIVGGWARKFDSLVAVTGCTAVAKKYFCNYHLQPKDGEYAKLLNWILEGWAKECESSPSVNSHLPGANKSTTGFHLNWLVVRWAKECDRYWQLIRCWKKNESGILIWVLQLVFVSSSSWFVDWGPSYRVGWLVC